MGHGSRWGLQGTVDFWTALESREVDTPELRAMSLLESLCDPYRFSLYCMTAEMPARGNLTGTTFMVLKNGGVIEFDEDGRSVADWCISIGPHASVPGTDNVVILKAMLEGEEFEFRKIGNRNRLFGNIGYRGYRNAPGVVVPHTVSWFPKEWKKAVAAHREDRKGPCRDPLDLPQAVEAEEWNMSMAMQGAMARGSHAMELALQHAKNWTSTERPKRPQYVPNSIFGDSLSEPWNADDEDEDRGVRLGDGSRLHWDTNQAQQAYLRTGVMIGDEVIRMNSEGYNRECIIWCLENLMGVRAWGAENGFNAGYGDNVGYGWQGAQPVLREVAPGYYARL